MRRLSDYCTRLMGKCIHVAAFLLAGLVVACGAKNRETPPPSSDREEPLRPVLMYGTPYKTYDAHRIDADTLRADVPISEAQRSRVFLPHTHTTNTLTL